KYVVSVSCVALTGAANHAAVSGSAGTYRSVPSAESPTRIPSSTVNADEVSFLFKLALNSNEPASHAGQLAGRAFQSLGVSPRPRADSDRRHSERPAPHSRSSART